MPRPAPASLAGLDLLPTAVVVLDEAFAVLHANPAAEGLLDASARSLIGQPFLAMFAELAALEPAVREALGAQWSYAAPNVTFRRPGRETLQLACSLTRTESPEAPFVVELRPIEQLLRIAREERLLSEQQVYRELIRNLAHEIRNPLGGLRGSAQLLERELPGPALREYTQVIIKEADRLQLLLDRLLTPHRPPKVGPLNIHETLERVRSIVQAEFGERVEIERDYDPSVPELQGDMEQLIQALLNVARNAAQAITAGAGGRGTILFRTRVLRQITIARQRYRLALELQIIDSGPGVPEAIRERIFHPLVSGREGGSGIGLSLAQTYVQYHGGVIECESRPGNTVFSILLPLA
ncbi:MAG: nitrogen regulation protein NR(II) [Burkholderiales bacterium]|nr:nitrogen regulation protein NR(II) [Burkholderiales bacterium]